MVSPTTARVVGLSAVIAGVAAALYLIIKPSAGQTQYHGTLTLNGSSSAIGTSTTGVIDWAVTGMTPGAAIQLGFDDTANPSSGRSVVATGTADSSGKTSGTVQLVPGTEDYVGKVFYATAYDTAIGTVEGYSNPVQVTITS